MAWDVAVEFEEAVEWLLERLPLSKAEFELLDAAARKRAFTVANVAQMHVIDETKKSLSQAIDLGTPLKEWAEEFGPTLEEAWAGTVANPSARLETIYRSNVQSSYSAGRERLASHPTVKRLRPYKRFDAVMDTRTTDDICRPLNGVVKPADDPWWNDHTPPLHYNCRSGTVTLTDEQAREEGITTDTPDAEPQHGWGARVLVTDDEWAPEQGDVDDDLWSEFQEKNQ